MVSRQTGVVVLGVLVTVYSALLLISFYVVDLSAAGNAVPYVRANVRKGKDATYAELNDWLEKEIAKKINQIDDPLKDMELRTIDILGHPTRAPSVKPTEEVKSPKETSTEIEVPSEKPAVKAPKENTKEDIKKENTKENVKEDPKKEKAKEDPTQGSTKENLMKESTKENSRVDLKVDKSTKPPKTTNIRGKELNQKESKIETIRQDAINRLESYITSHTSFPILLLCHARPDKLKVTIESLLAVRGVDKSDIFVVQDGTNTAVKAVIDGYGFRHISRPQTVLPPNERKDPGFTIAQHYKFALTEAMRMFPSAPGIVIVEDDFLFSPDFMEYMLAVAPAIEKDPTLWIASAWNDNGQVGNAVDKARLLRTNYFPGLGWLLLRSIWDQIKTNWPRGHWDWYMRNPKTSLQRDVVIPEVSRVYHTGSKGAFMDEATHKKYFDGIVYNTDELFRWPVDAANSVMVEQYDARLEKEIKEGVALVDGNDLREGKDTHQTKIIWYNQDPFPSPPNEKILKPFAEEFKIWHQIMRGSRQGVHELWYQSRQKVFLINIFDPRSVRLRVSTWFHGYPNQTPWIRLKPEDARVFDLVSLVREIKGLPLEEPTQPTQSTAALTKKP